jgi:hypothetical protein
VDTTAVNERRSCVCGGGTPGTVAAIEKQEVNDIDPVGLATQVRVGHQQEVNDIDPSGRAYGLSRH